MLIKKMFGLTTILLFFPFARIINGNFQLDDFKSSKLTHLLLAKNLTLQFDIRQENMAQVDLFRIAYNGDELLFRLTTSTLQTPNIIFLAFGLRDGRQKLFKIYIPFLLGDNQFHKILLILNGQKMDVLHNCNQLFSSEDNGLEFSHQSTEGLDLNITLGSGSHRNDGALLLRSFSSNVALSAANSLCPHLNRIDNIRVEIEHRNSSIFDRNFRIDDENRQNVGERISKLEKRINQWDKLISRLGDRLRSVELHQRGCKIAGGWYKAGQRVQEQGQCRECHCSSDGGVHCAPIGCPRLECTHPVIVDGKCCPECGKTCFYNGQNYKSGDSFWPKPCVHCLCDNGRMNCEFRNFAHCPTLHCEQQETLPNQCCPVCVNIDHCATIGRNLCDSNAFCISTRHSAQCQCKPGFFGNGTKCYDIDECLWDENARAQLGGCGIGSICINLPGSFKCDCLPGFQKLDDRNCMDVVRI